MRGLIFINKEKGVSLVEIIVVIMIASVFLVIVISDFPKIMRQYALSRVTYKLAQDLRKTQDFGLSGFQLYDGGVPPQAILAKGYGIYFDINTDSTKYLIYADVANADGVPSEKFDGDFSTQLCSQVTQTPDQLHSDCVIEVVDIKNENASLSFQIINNLTDGFNSTSINFAPPNPKITIDNLDSSKVGVEIVLTNTDGATRTVYTNKAGLINVQ